VVTEISGVKIWVPALLWPMAYTALYYRTGVTTDSNQLSQLVGFCLTVVGYFFSLEADFSLNFMDIFWWL